MDIRFVVGEILFWLHLPIVLIWVGLFFIPSSLWPEKITFHFWFIALVFLSQMLWGLVMLPIRKHFGLGLCPLTTLTQWARGHPLTDKHNYDHAFLNELFDRMGIPISLRWIHILLLLTLVIVIIQYISR